MKMIRGCSPELQAETILCDTVSLSEFGSTNEEIDVVS